MVLMIIDIKVIQGVPMTKTGLVFVPTVRYQSVGAHVPVYCRDYGQPTNGSVILMHRLMRMPGDNHFATGIQREWILYYFQ